MNHISKECCSLNCGFDLLAPNNAIMSFDWSKWKACRNSYLATGSLRLTPPCLLKSSINCSK
jgi:hypothetical protein